jgi:hypothetical protein
MFIGLNAINKIELKARLQFQYPNNVPFYFQEE